MTGIGADLAIAGAAVSEAVLARGDAGSPKGKETEPDIGQIADSEKPRSPKY